jgi:Txe/YoeB family toxin of Txe-Axe toxin-antitoxin module
MQKIVEDLAEIIHNDLWTPFAKGIMESESLSQERLDRWNSQCFMPYENLSEEMKEKDRYFARKFLPLIERIQNDTHS